MVSDLAALTGLRLLLAIGLAFALWVFVSYTQNPDQPAPLRPCRLISKGWRRGYWSWTRKASRKRTTQR